MITKLGLTLSLAMLFAPSCFAQDAASQKFLNEAIEGNFAQVQMGQLAKKQTTDQWSVRTRLKARTGVEVVVKHEKPHADRGFQGARSSCPLAESTDLAFPV